MSKEPNYITPGGFRKLQDEFRALFNDERPKLVETVAWAAGNGDRSENGDYIYGKRRLREIDRRLKFLRDRIESARIIEPAGLSGTKVVFGATVTLLTETDEEKVVQIVGEDEIDLSLNRVSWRSPVARALLGRSVGDEVTIERPAGALHAEITAVEFK